LDPGQVYKRCRDGKELSYIPGWVAISEANAVFGYAGWDRQTIQLERLYERSSQEGITCGYMAKVRVVVRAGNTAVTREGTGFGTAIARLAADAHEKALKSAETDATKRALATFGNRFGLFLYQGAKSQPALPRASLPQSMLPRATAPQAASPGFRLTAPDGTTLASDLSPEAFAGGLRQLIEKSDRAEALNTLIDLNQASLSRLESECPQLVSRSNRHYAAILRNLASNKKRVIDTAAFNAQLVPQANSPSPEKAANGALQTPTQGVEPLDNVQSERPVAPENSPSKSLSQEVETAPPGPASPSNSHIGIGQRIDKSILAYRSERRIRSKQHLLHVADHPCIICGEAPSHAHHITYAQPRGLAVKVSDEFTVPLCVIHHNHVHQNRPEMAWWKNQGVDPMPVAAQLWCDTLRRATANTS
jgi:Rad52/22 family double-strand break repair protein